MPLDEVEVCEKVTRCLGLRNCKARVCWGCEEFDVVCVIDGFIVVVEVKSVFNEGNRLRVENQLWARRCVADEVWLAVPENDAWFASAVLPSWVGVLAVGASGCSVVRYPRNSRLACVSGVSSFLP